MAIALAELIDPRQIALNLRARTQSEAIREIADLLVSAEKIDNREKFLEELRKVSSLQEPRKELFQRR